MFFFIRKLLFLIFFFLSSAAFAYQTLHTEHFYIHFPDKVEKKTILELGSWAEGAYQQLRKIFPYDVAPVHIQVHHQRDLSNGNALTILFNKINVYLTPPAFDSELPAKNWFQSLIIHELTHIFELDASNGYASALRFIFGKPPIPLTTPNYTAPWWFHEGMAVLNETLYTSDGRLNSTSYDTLYRKNVLFRDFPPISRFATYENNPEYPYRNSPYIYGAGIFDSIYRSIGKKNPTGKLSDIHGGRFYYWFNSGLETLLEEEKKKPINYTDMYELFQKNEFQRQQQNLEKIREQKITRPNILFRKKDGNLKALVIDSPGNRAFFIASSATNKNALYLYHFKTGKTKKLFEASLLGNRITVGNFGQHIYFNAYRQRNLRIEAVPYLYNLQKGKAVPLKDLSRFEDIAPSPSEQKIAGIRIDEQGKKHLEIYFPAEEKSQRVWEDTRAIHPFFLDEENLMVLDYNGKRTAFVKIALSDSSRRTLFEVPGKSSHPVLKQGIIYFSADSNGVWNLYQYALAEKKVQPLSNLETAGIYPGVFRNSICFLWLQETGYVLSAFKPDFSYTELPRISPLRLEVSEYRPKAVKNSWKWGNYSPFSYLNFYWWSPFFQLYNDRTYLGAMTSWQDPLNHHYLFLAADYDFQNGDPQYIFNYIYLSDEGFTATLKADKTLSVYRNAPLNPVGYTNYRQEEFDHSIYLGYTLTTFDFSFSLLGGGVFNYWKAKESPENLYFRFYEGSFYGPSAYFTFTNQDFYLKSVRMETGFTFTAFYTYFLKPEMRELGTDLAFSLPGPLAWFSFWEDVLASKNNFRGIFGKKMPQDYYSLGGLPILSETSASLRGYPAGYLSGYYYYLGSLEYTVPIAYVFLGWGNRPLFLRALYLNFFYDFAQTAQINLGEITLDNFTISYGAELGLSSYLFHILPLDLILGYAYAYNTGETSFYFTLKLPMEIPGTSLERTVFDKYGRKRDKF